MHFVKDYMLGLLDFLMKNHGSNYVTFDLFIVWGQKYMHKQTKTLTHECTYRSYDC